VPSAERVPRGRGLNDTDLLANDSDGVSEFAREATLKKTTFPSNLQLQQMNLKDGVPWGMRGWWPGFDDWPVGHVKLGERQLLEGPIVNA
jgi:hypothetical protein